MKTEIPGLIMTMQPTVAVAQHLLIAPDGTLADSVKPVGVALESGIIGEDTPICLNGIVLVVCASAVTKDDLLIASSGKVATNALASVADLSKACGIALEAGAASDDIIRMKIL